MSMELRQSTGSEAICWAQLSKLPAPKSENRVKVTMMPAATCPRPTPPRPFHTHSAPVWFAGQVFILLLVDVETEAEALARGHRAQTGTHSAEHPRSRRWRGRSGARARWSAASRGSLPCFSQMRLSIGWVLDEGDQFTQGLPMTFRF